MKIVFLDAKTIGDDIDLSGYEELGEVVKYDFSSSEEVPARVIDADVLVLNKVQVNEHTIGTARNLKLVCVTATGTNNLDKDYLDRRNIAWRNVAGYSTETVTQHTFAMLFYLLEKLRYYDDYVKNGNYINDTCFKGAYVVKNILDCYPLCEGMALFQGSDRTSEYYDSLKKITDAQTASMEQIKRLL